jgi:hypothetical protein
MRFLFLICHDLSLLQRAYVALLVSNLTVGISSTSFCYTTRRFTPGLSLYELTVEKCSIFITVNMEHKNLRGMFSFLGAFT